ncbi:HlyD family efflux transporter periplasmic adaptor subunit [uncultured Xylophilus sp.]|uniref:efflux RND transporter periplasmic adaptor subunit n=1 Tax=uncultured Xylophilus sp. TaxID=296832 RepID=UPI0025F921D5|nr:HlyD family efflux transporter periplasmic adaptor subunit [uncultured Xylophilus sp.]
MNRCTVPARSRIASVLGALALVLCTPVRAHGDAVPAVASAGVAAQGPQRQPDGSVFLPKPAQHAMALRTAVVAVGPLARTTELAGTVAIDPNAGGTVQALLAGRLEPGPRGLPSVGQAVRKGEVLAYVVPSAGALEQSTQAAQLAELRAARTLADKRLARLRELSDTVPRREIEAVESEAASLSARIAAVGAGLSRRDALVAPVAGVIARADAVAGQVVDARERLFDVVDPSRLRVEARAYDPTLAQDIAAAHVAVGAQRIPLQFVGAARILREQALPLVFRAQGDGLAALAVGQPLPVYVQGRTQVQGAAVPASALARNAANETVVWVKTAPEHFAPRVVTTAPLDGASVAVTQGLAAGERVVVQGTALLNQIR